jgi:glycosyltransferase involved in cell wall biosynthesis
MTDNWGSLAPIALFAFNRPQHLEKCLSSLLQNAESSTTRLYCFLDGPRNESDIRHVEQARQIARTARGFLDVRILERDHNRGLSRSIIDGVSRVLEKHKRVIVVEDDLVVSPAFLRYMNEALRFYAPTPGVFSVSGYNYPQKILRIPGGYPYDAFFVQRHMCWGWGTWRDRWKRADWRVKNYDSLSRNESWKRSFEEGGVDLPGTLDAQVHGQLDSWAIRWSYAHFVNHGVCLVPVKSLVNNMGVDDSGVHMKASRRYFHRSLSGKDELALPPLIYIDPLIARAYKTAERRNLLFRAAVKMAKVIRTGRQQLSVRRFSLERQPAGFPYSLRESTGHLAGAPQESGLQLP